MTAGLDHDALFKQRGNIFGQRLGRAHVGDCDLRAFMTQKQGRRQTGFAQTYNQNLLAFEIHHARFVLTAFFISVALEWKAEYH